MLVTVKLYHQFLKSLKNCGHDTKLMYLLFLGRHALGKLRPVLLESRNVRRDSRLARGW